MDCKGLFLSAMFVFCKSDLSFLDFPFFLLTLCIDFCVRAQEKEKLIMLFVVFLIDSAMIRRIHRFKGDTSGKSQHSLGSI